jgi:membrane protease YdiL (CAAX protease family)
MERIMPITIDKKRIFIFLAFAFGIAWFFGLIVYLTGGLANSPEIIPGSNITLAILLLTLGYMWAPALGNIFTRLITKQGWGDLWLNLAITKNWKPYLAAWFLPAVLTIIGAAVYFVFYPSQFDITLTIVKDMMEKTMPQTEVSPWLLVSGNFIQAILIAPIINSFFTFGEEFGWRGYLLPNLLPMGEKRAFLVSGVIWGLWHAPVIAMGHNYGLDYWGFPWLGIIAMTWFCILAGTFLGWLSILAKNAWPGVIGHAAINGIAGLPILFTIGTPNLILGPLVMGFIGVTGFLLAAIWIFFRSDIAKPKS